MFYRVREFADGIGPLLTGALALLVGAIVGALVTVQMSGGTPYSQADLDRVSDHVRASGAHTGRAADVAGGGHANQVARLQGRNQKLAEQLTNAKTMISDLQGRLAAAATPSATATGAPEPTAAPTPTEASGPTAAPTPTVVLSPTAPTPSSPSSPSASALGLRVTGTLDVSWVLSSQVRPWPASCANIVSGYRVRVDAGRRTAVALGVPTGFRQTGRTTKDGTLTVSCAVTYAATLPSSRSSAYRLVAVSQDAPDKPLDTAVVQAADLAGGKLPVLAVSYCPDCSVGH